MPVIGCGVFRVPPGDETYKSVKTALELGYRHVDTAAIYKNEQSVGEAIRDSGLPREQIFVTTKLNTFVQKFTYDETLQAIRNQLQKLGMQYVDLYLIHCPRDTANRVSQWRALIEAQKQGLAKSIGVSDYEVPQLKEIADAGLATPAVLQIEVNPWLAGVRKAELDHCKQNGIVVQAWGVMAKNGKDDDSAVAAVAARHPGKTVPDILLKWGLQMGYVTLTTSRNPAHQQSNLAAAADSSWQLAHDDMKALASLANDPFFSMQGSNLSGEKK